MIPIVEDACAGIEHDFFMLYLNMEFHQLNSSIKKLLGTKGHRKVLLAMRKPIMLSESGEAALELYEDHVSFLLSARLRRNNSVS